MSWLKQFAFRCRTLFRQEKLDADMAEEMRLHLELRTQRNIEAGMTPDDARYDAQRGFGGVEQIKETARDERSWIWLEQLGRDFRFATRSLRKSPGLCLTAITTLALAIGVNSTVFTLVHGLMLRPLIPHRPAEVVGVFTARKDANRDYRQFSHGEYLALRTSSEVFRDVTAVSYGVAGIGREEGLRRSFVFLTPENFFSFMGVEPALGRFYTADEARPNANAQVAVASYSFWQRSGGSAAFVGSTVHINLRPFTIIGVAPKDFSGLSAIIAPDLWLPLGVFSSFSSLFGDANRLTDLNEPKNHTLNVIGRLLPGLTQETAKLRLPRLEERLAAIQPPDVHGVRELELHTLTRIGISTQPGHDGIDLLGILTFAMAGVVLVIACLNLANMLLARGLTRAREIAVRLALGATRWQIIRQLLVEGLLLALVGGAAGLLLSVWSNSFLLASFSSLLGSMNYSLAFGFEPDGTVLAVTFAFCLLATLFFSLGPALKAARADLVHDLKRQTGDDAASGRWNRFFSARHVLVMGQMTLSLVLLFAGGLAFQGSLKAGDLDLGVNPDGVVMTEFDFSLANTPPAEGLRQMSAIRDRVNGLPGVRAAGFSTLLPYGNTTNTTRLFPTETTPSSAPANPGRQTPGPAGAHGLFVSVTPGYFEALGVRLLRGRDFTAADAVGSPRVVIIDEPMATRLFPGEDAVGRRVNHSQSPAVDSPEGMEIVGVVSRHRHDVTDAATGRPHVFVPLAHTYSGSVFLSTRFETRDAAQTTGQVGLLRRDLRQLDPDLPILQMRPLADLFDKNITLWIIRLGAVMFGVFAAIALLLAVVGVYGVKAYAVERRTREIGIRMALGASPRDVFALVMKQGAVQTVVSVGLGAVISLAVGQALAAILFQVSPMDPLALGISALILAAATLLACFLPARRATKVSPLVALRSE